jgi:hypothetical protein
MVPIARPCAVDHATDVAVQGHVIQFPFSRVGFALIFLAGVVHRAQLRLTVQRVAVDTDLRVEAVQVALLGDHQRIDFYQRQILVDEHLSQTHENLHELLDLVTGQAQLEGQFTALVGLWSHQRIDRGAEDFLRRLFGDFFDFHTAFSGGHEDNTA